MRPRLFTTMLGAFALVIVLGVCGMLGFFTLAFVNATRQAETRWNELIAPGRGNGAPTLARALTDALAGYYARNNSWDGVEQQADSLRLIGETGNLLTYTLVDMQGNVVATNQPGVQAGQANPTTVYLQASPIRVNGEQVGTFYLSQRRQPMRGWAPGNEPMEPMGPGPIFGPEPVGSATNITSFLVSGFAQGLLSGGLALVAILLLLATFFSRRISRPLNQLTGAAQALAGGNMAVRVKGSGVRELDELSRAFNRMADSLVQADQQRRQLTADVAHELRTPLSIIKGRLEGVQDGVYEASPEQINGLLDEVALLERLIEDLRLLALADAGQLPIYPESLEPARLLHDVARSFAPQAVERGVSLHVDAAENLPDIQADPQRIAQVLGNLVGNALRYTPAGGAITLRVSLKGNEGNKGNGSTNFPAFPSISFAVSDTGAGIAPDDLPHIFDRFYRADRSRTRASGGAGLGLAIARRIVEAHGGSISVESQVGQGTTFCFRLPVEGKT